MAVNFYLKLCGLRIFSYKNDALFYPENFNALFYFYQNEKRKMLMEHETSKLKQLEEQHSIELQEWKASLIPRKQVIKDT